MQKGKQDKAYPQNLELVGVHIEGVDSSKDSNFLPDLGLHFFVRIGLFHCFIEPIDKRTMKTSTQKSKPTST